MSCKYNGFLHSRCFLGSISGCRLPVAKFTWKAMGSFQQNRVRLIGRRSARLHSIFDKRANPYGYQSYGILGMRHNSPSHVPPRIGLLDIGLCLD